MADSSLEQRSSIIGAVKTPLGFFVLGLLVVDGTLAALAVALDDFRAPLVWTVIGSVPALALTVVLLAIFRPEALRGDRPWQETYANQLADDLYLGLDGALHNLEQAERIEAWLTVADVIVSTNVAEIGYTKFCDEVAARLKKRANLHNRGVNTRGAIDSTAREEVDPTQEAGKSDS